MILNKIILENFRSHKYFEFVPIQKGITAISGKNGAGKSTIVDAFAWSLFGTKLHGLKNKDYIRETVDPKKEKVQVTTLMTVGNRDYMIIRRILNDSGTSDCVVHSRPSGTSEAYIVEAGPTITHAENFIRNLLGCDEKGFFYSIFIQQKQVDQIINASAKEKGLVIEQLLGISFITKAMEISKTKSKELQKAASITQPGSLEDELKKVETQKELVINLLGEAKTIKKKTEILKNEIEKQTKIFNEESERQEKFNNLFNKNQVLKAEIEQLQKTIQNNTETFQVLVIDKNIPKIELNEAQKEFDKVQKEKIEIEIEISNLNNSLRQLEKLFEKIIKKDILDLFEKTEKQKESLDNSIKDIEVKIALNKDKLKHTKNYIEQLDKGIADCPMCGNPITDKEKEKERILKEFEVLKNETQSLQNELPKIKLENDKVLAEAIKIKSFVDLYYEQQDKKEELSNLKNKKVQLETKRESIELNFKKISDLLESIKLYQNNIKMIEKVKKDIKQDSETLSNKNKEMLELDLEIKNINAMSKKDFVSLTSNFNKMKDSLQKLEIMVIQKDNDLSQAKLKGKSLVEGYEKCKKAVEEYTQITNQILEFNETTKSLSLFRDNQITQSRPKLTSLASEILRKFTGGDYIQLDLSPSFEITVTTKDGQERMVEKLSGGEMSTVAIALRIAISLFLHNGDKSLLILDEVLVSMCEERSHNILETISSLAQSQIIIIAHSPIISEISDTIIYI